MPCLAVAMVISLAPLNWSCTALSPPPRWAGPPPQSLHTPHFEAALRDSGLPVLIQEASSSGPTWGGGGWGQSTSERRTCPRLSPCSSSPPSSALGTLPHKGSRCPSVLSRTLPSCQPRPPWAGASLPTSSRSSALGHLSVAVWPSGRHSSQGAPEQSSPLVSEPLAGSQAGWMVSGREVAGNSGRATTLTSSALISPLPRQSVRKYSWQDTGEK